VEKEIVFKLDYLGAIKQAPVVIKEILKLNPDLRIQFHSCGSCEKERLIIDIIRDCFAYEGIKLKVEDVMPFPSLLYVNFLLSNDGVCFLAGCAPPLLKIPIDPLKFEKRRLVNQAEITALKKKYFIDSDKVILGVHYAKMNCIF
jgi:hypothetical protein